MKMKEKQNIVECRFRTAKQIRQGSRGRNHVQLKLYISDEVLSSPQNIHWYYQGQSFPPE
jgi:hypothetical protein